MTILPKSYIGHTVSKGTYIQEELLGNFMTFLNTVAAIVSLEEKYQELENDIKEAKEQYLKGDEKFQAFYFITEEVYGILADIAPEGSYWGMKENPSHFGFWKLAEDEAAQ